jgi:serine phosphatase RsbU (regulator of sigma subunit)
LLKGQTVTPHLLLRQDDLVRWLVPLMQAAGVAFRLVAADGKPLLQAGAPSPEGAAHPVVVHGKAIAHLTVGPGHGEAFGGALAEALAAFGEARYSLNDFSHSLATAWKESNFLADLSRLLQDVVDVEAAAQVAVRQLARVQRADHVALYTDGRGTWRRVASFPEAADEPEAPAPTDEPVAAVEGDSCRIRVPLREGADTLGMLTLQGPASLAHASNMQFLGNVAAQITQALRLRLRIQDRLEAAQLRRELELGAELQRSLLPQSPPVFAGACVAAACHSAQMVGGDGYDYAAHSAGLDLVLADVSGHGVAAGLLMSSFLGMVRTLDRARTPPAELARLANRRIVQEVGLSGQYVTAVCARVAPGARRLTYATMGHPVPLLCRGGRVAPLPVAPGLPAGLDEDGRYREAEVPLEPGDVVVFYTDGLVEARSPDGSTLGVEGLARAVAGAPVTAAAVLRAVFEAADAFAGGRAPHDDQTAIVLHIPEEA